MGHTDTSLINDLYYSYPLARMDGRDERDMGEFKPIDTRGWGLVRYLQSRALADELRGTMRTYLVRDAMTDELVGYFSLKAGLVSINEAGDEPNGGFDTVPGVELANFAMNATFRTKHPEARGCGRVVFRRLVLPTVERAAKIVGIATLYIFSLPEERVIANYESYGFQRLAPADESALHSRLKPRYDEQCVFMYMML